MVKKVINSPCIFCGQYCSNIDVDVDYIRTKRKDDILFHRGCYIKNNKGGSAHEESR